MISHKHQAIFFHVPKCAGQTINKLLSNTVEFIPMHKTTGFTKVVDRYLPFKYYWDVVLKERELSSPRSTLKIALANLKYLGKPTLELNSYRGKVNDELSGEFRIGIYRSLQRSINQQTWKEYYKLTFVRNPYDRLVSAWAFLTSEGRGAGKLNINFPDFVKAVVNSDYRLLDKNLREIDYVDLEWHTMPMVKHLKDANGEISMDFIGKVESFDSDCKSIFERFDLSTLNIVNVRINASTHKDYQQLYNSELESLVYNFYKEDFETFGYNKKV